MKKSTCIEIASGDLSEIQLIKLLSTTQTEWISQYVIQSKLKESNDELQTLVQELKIELKDTSNEALEN